jgi:hypothetical protein
MVADDFEQWMNRPTYVVQCCTRRIAVEMFPENAGMFRFRAKPEYRNDAARALRTAVALKVRELRRTGELTRESMRKVHKERAMRIGEAWMIDMETETRAIAARDPADCCGRGNSGESGSQPACPDQSLTVVGIQDVFPRSPVPENELVDEATAILIDKQTMEDLLKFGWEEPAEVRENKEGEV